MEPWVWLLIIAVIIVIVWWLLSRSAKEAPPSIEASHDPTVETTEGARVAEVVEAPTPGKPDDLTVLEGIGPKVNSLLQAAGISTFAQLASTELSKLREILDAAGYPYIDPATWSEQAQLAAEGKWQELEQLTASLKGGRKVS